MPALDYVSIIRSVYGDRRALLFGAFASASVAVLTAIKAEAPILFAVAVAILLVGVIRFANMRAFWRAAIGDEDAEAAEHWENRALAGGALVAFTHGMWCLVAILVVQDPFAELASCTLTIASTVGMVARNFGLDRLLTIQIISLSVPLWVAMFFRGDFYHQALAAMLVLLLISFRKLGGDVRALLLSAVHGRVDASRLAAELDMAMTTLEHGLCMLDQRGVISVANERATRLFSMIGVSDLVGRPFGSVLADLSDSKTLPSAAIEQLADLISTRSAGKVLLFLPGQRYFEVTVSSRRARCVLLFEDISERIASEERITFMARHDTLTGLPNRTYFGELAGGDLNARRQPNAEDRLVGLTLVDIDDFKHVNDTFGHMIGDQLLVQVAARLQKAVPTGVVLARLGGDEFVLYRGALEQPDQAKMDAKAILAAFAEPFLVADLTLSVTVSLGLATSAAVLETLNDLMTKADLALYSAKGDGKARSQTFHAQMDIDYHYRQRLKADLREAVSNGALSLAFQPLLDIKSRKVVTCEALARWNHSELGMIPPSTFIPLAEEMGLISEITSWVLQRATQQCSQWPGEVCVAVNISARDFRVGHLASLVDKALAASGLPPSRLEIEVTETAVIEEREIAHRVLAEFAKKGIAIALDDFGTGYSSLSYLNALPFTKLKIDRSFVADIAHNARALRLFANVARLGRDLELTVVAEGVETEAQLKTMLAHTQVQQVQGFYFSRPVVEAEIGALIGRLNGEFQTVETNRRHG